MSDGDSYRSQPLGTFTLRQLLVATAVAAVGAAICGRLTFLGPALLVVGGLFLVLGIALCTLAGIIEAGPGWLFKLPAWTIGTIGLALLITSPFAIAAGAWMAYVNRAA